MCPAKTAQETMYYVLDEVDIQIIGELIGPLKSIGSLFCCGVCSERDHLVLNNGTTADSNVPDWSVSQYIVPVKNPSPAMRPFVKIL